MRLDKEADDAVKKASLHRKVATTIFFESNGGMSQAKADASVPEIKTDVFGPDTNLADLDNVLEGLATTCYYLNWDRNRYRFGLSPNLNQILVSRRGAVQPKAIEERIRQQTQKLFDKHTVDASKLIDRKYWPARSNDVPNRPMLTLVGHGAGYPGRRKEDHGADGVDCPRLRIERPDVQIRPDLRRAGLRPERSARRPETLWPGRTSTTTRTRKSGSMKGRRACSQRNLKNAQRDLDEAIFRTYRHVYLLGKDNKLRPIDLGQITSSSAGSIVELILRELQRCEEITDGISPSQADQVLAAGPGRMVHEGGAGRVLLVAATLAIAESRVHQAHHQRRRHPGTARLCQQGRGRPAQTGEVQGEPARRRRGDLGRHVHSQGRRRPESCWSRRAWRAW